MIWLPFANTKANLEVLRDDHVMDVVFEGLQCLRNIYNGQLSWLDAKAWAEHPAALLAYVASAEREMVRRGHAAEPRVIRAQLALSRAGWPLAPVPPWWFGNPEFHMAQRSSLIRIAPEYYAHRLPPTTLLELPLLWPSEMRFQ